ncbi:hypothetical protein ACFE04_016572 [Oxalis oulophora]
MTTDAESPEQNNAPSPSPPPPPPPPVNIELPTIGASKTLEDISSFVDNSLVQALVYQKTIEESIDAAVDASRSRLSQIRETSSAHLQQSIYSLKEVLNEYRVYEEVAVGYVKEGVNVAVSHPLITGGTLFGLGALILKRPRRCLYYSTLRLFTTEEAMLAKADAKVKELRQSISLLKADSEKLERRASLAEEELIRGKTKLRQAGKQIQGVIRSAYKIEREAAGLKDVIRELPGREASLFRTQVSNLASVAKQERNTLSKEDDQNGVIQVHGLLSFPCEVFQFGE